MTARLDRSGSPRHPRLLQVSVGALALLQLAYAALGLAANPDFATGSAATAERFLGVDFNGWHAISGFLLFGPGLVAALHRAWARWYCVVVPAVLLVTAAWGLLDDRPLGLLFSPDATSDAVFHLASAASFLALVAADSILGSRPATGAPASA